MKLILIFLLLLNLFSVFTFKINQLISNHSNSINSSTQILINIRAVYPDNKLAFNDKLYLRGDGCGLNWTTGIQMSHINTNTSALIITCYSNDTVQVKILLNDKVWMFGANFMFNPIIYGSYFWIYPSFTPNINKVYDTEPITSKILNNSRKCSIYLPPSYHDNTMKPYPLIFMHDGQNLFQDSKAAFGVAWKIQDTLTDLIAKGLIEQVIVVGIWNTNDRNNQYTYSYDPSYKFGGKGDLYLNFIQQELEPIVRNQWFFNRLKSAKYTIGGSSLGGLISCYAMYKRSSFFSNAICMSSSFWWNNEDFNNKVLSSAYNKTTNVYLDSGDAGTSQDGKNQTLTVKAHLQQIGYVNSGQDQNLFYYLDKGGQHSQYFWGRRFYIPMTYLFGIRSQV